MRLSSAAYATLAASLLSATAGGGVSAFVVPDPGTSFGRRRAPADAFAGPPAAPVAAPAILMADSPNGDGDGDRDDDAGLSSPTDDDGSAAAATDQIAPTIPLTFEEMVRDASRAVADAFEAGLTRQVVRVLLPRDPGNDQLGRYFESDANVDTQNLVLAPPDETWQGGIMQLYRAAAPTCQEILRRFSKGIAGVPPKLVEDRSVDESGVDGVGLWMTQSTSPSDDVSCFVQPSQETVDAVESISGQAGGRLVLLMNPQWRNADDALDAASKGGGVFGSVASFLGGKGRSLERLDEMGFRNVYTLEGYVVKGGNIRMVKRFDSDWAVFAENDSATDFIKVGTSESRPTYQDIDKMLDEKGIALKYARDIGLAPKI